MMKKIFIFIAILSLVCGQDMFIEGSQKPDLTEYQGLPSLTFKQNKPKPGNPIDFNHTIPDVFLVNQIFTFAGVINSENLFQYLRPISPPLSSWSVHIVLKDKKTEDKLFIFQKKMDFNDERFVKHVHFKHPGQYDLFIIFGNSGYQPVKTIEVIDIPINNNNVLLERPSNFRAEVKSNDLYLMWDQKQPLTKIQFSQNNGAIKKQFIVSNDLGYLIVPYQEFVDFTKTMTKIQISHAKSKGISAFEISTGFSAIAQLQIPVTRHEYQIIDNVVTKVDFNVPIRSVIMPGQKINFAGTSSKELYPQALILNSNGSISQVYLNLRKKATDSFSFEFEALMLEKGTHFIELYYSNRTKFINTPIYVGNLYPLLPDPFDIASSQSKDEFFTLLSPDELREYILERINKKREQYGLKSVVLDEKLNKLAQDHVVEMIVFGYVEHENMKGQDVQKRASKMKIFGKFAQNIEISSHLELLRHKLDRSPRYLLNTIQPDFQKVGIGIWQDLNTVFYIVEDYFAE